MKTSLLLVSLVVTLFSVLPNSALAGGLSSCDNSHNPNCVWVADYLVVGSGAGGAPIMRKLSDDSSYSVIGFEAGKYISDDPVIALGQNMFSVYASPNIYNYQMKTNFDPYLGKVSDIMIGYGSGGSTSINGMQFLRPSPQFGQVLQTYGGADWNTAALALAYKSMENFTSNEGTIAPTRGTKGPVNVRRPDAGPVSGPGSISNNLAKWTAAASGIPQTADYNDPTNPTNAFGSFPRYQIFQDAQGNRESSVTAFLPKSVLNTDGTSVGRKRQLRVLYEATVKKVIIENKVAKGVIFELEGETYTALARKEVIIASNIFTTQLLQLSGIGPASLLQSLGIPVIVNNPNVGSNMRNHVSLTLPFLSNAGDLPGYAGTDFASIYSGGALLPRWDADGPLTNHSLLYDPREYQLIWFTSGFSGLFVGPLQPKTTGTETIQSSNPIRVPLHNENTFSATEDLDKYANFLFHFVQNTLFPYMHAQDPAYDIGWVRWNNIAETKAYIQANVGFTLHYCCHARMAPSAATGVVDSKGRVYGVSGLRVSGAAALPVLPDATPASISMVMGWKISDYIIADRRGFGFKN